MKVFSPIPRLATLCVAGLLTVAPDAPGAIIGFGDGSGFTLNYSPGFDTTGPRIANGVLMLTDNVNLEARSAFFNVRQDVRQFGVHFVYQGTPYPGSAGLGDGVTFTIQNDARGAKAVGNSGGGLGYEGITPSVAIELNQFGLPKVGTFLGVNGTTGSSRGGYLPTTPVALDSGDPIAVDLVYDGTTLTESLTDLTTGATFRTGFAINIAQVVGGTTAYMGFTGGTGLFTSNQTIRDFAEVVPEPASIVLLAIGSGLALGGRAAWRPRAKRAGAGRA